MSPKNLAFGITVPRRISEPPVFAGSHNCPRFLYSECDCSFISLSHPLDTSLYTP